MNSLLIATTNKKKAKEIEEILQGIPFKFKLLIQIKGNINVEETGKTYRENAVLKAKIFGENFNTLTLAEDSGLEIDALDGRPGVYSARYTGGSDLNRIKKVLRELEGVAKEKRTARFIAVAALYNPFSKKIFTAEGINEGVITKEPLGYFGFGYDPIFYNPKLQKTNAQANPAEKNLISHRAIALIQIKNYLLKKD